MENGIREWFESGKRAGFSAIHVTDAKHRAELEADNFKLYGDNRKFYIRGFIQGAADRKENPPVRIIQKGRRRNL
jgi:hypothetical protein